MNQNEPITLEQRLEWGAVWFFSQALVIGITMRIFLPIFDVGQSFIAALFWKYLLTELSLSSFLITTFMGWLCLVISVLPWVRPPSEVDPVVW